jgi:hypothetical protein
MRHYARRLYAYPAPSPLRSQDGQTPKGHAMAARKTPKPVPLATLTIHTFNNRVGEAFRVKHAPRRAADMELIEVTDLTHRAGPAVAHYERAPFSLVFRGPSDLNLPQQIFKVEHEGIGAFDLFLVPIGPDAKGTRYEAIFT